nr:hypothetical protein [Tanacetum cinerariifolium]
MRHLSLRHQTMWQILPEDDQADYPADGGDGDDEPSNDEDDDDTDDEDPEEDPFEDEEMRRRRRSTISGAPLGYRAAEIRIRALLPFTSRMIDIPKADMPPQKRDCLTTPAPGFEIEESSTAGTDEIVDTLIEIAPTTLERVNERVTELDTTIRQRTDEFEIRFEEAMYAREAWAYSEDRSSAIAAYVRTLETQVAALIAQTSSLQTQLTTTLGRIEILEARDPEPQEGPAEAGSSCERIQRKGQNWTKSRKNGKRGKARKSQEQSQSIKEEKLNKM